MGRKHQVRFVSLTATGLLALTSFPWALLPFVAFLFTSSRKRAWAMGPPAVTVAASLGAVVVATGASVENITSTAGFLLLGFVLFLLVTRLTNGDTVPLYLGIAAGVIVLASSAAREIAIWDAVRASGPFHHPNFLSGLAVTSGVALLGAAAGTFRASERVFFAVGGAAAILTVLLSGSRGGLLALTVAAAGAAAMCMRRRPGGSNRGARLFPAIATIGLVVATLFVLSGQVGGIDPLQVDERSDVDSLLDDRGRLNLWMTLLEVAAESPLVGYGFHGWLPVLAELEPGLWPEQRSSHSHSLFLEFVLDGGTVLLVACSAFLLTIARSLARGARDKTLAVTGLAVLLAATVHNITDVLLYHPQQVVLLWLVIAPAFTREISPADSSGKGGAVRQRS
jgi:O-antigen ligase